MAAKVHPHGATRLAFHCPGCKHAHEIRTVRENGPQDSVWEWNGSFDKPTFKPSVRVTSSAGVCHFNINDGEFNYHHDTTVHALRGKVPMEDWE